MRKPKNPQTERHQQVKKNLSLIPPWISTQPSSLTSQEPGVGLYDRPPFAPQVQCEAGQLAGENIHFTLATPPPEGPKTNWISRLKTQMKVQHEKQH
ncbi:hypothetical protein [Deinococcus roseus]|uniref:Uncharacterized protein n=1 Tax=Deinococcus roseus TaxID=392414 RepID=A0ABQ2DJ89_9DEIO|nr:hypothetical protein [Deinococcus roseus]GGJ59465.1 hypothetical protein GCM10008938_52020 [Deinococcus roseus]